MSNGSYDLVRRDGDAARTGAAVVRVEELRKEFRALEHHRGLFGAIRNLASNRGHLVKAVDGISFALSRGEFVGYVGPNGAGKSTTIKMLSGILVPSSGKIEVNGIVPHRERKANARQIGVVFGQRTQLWWDLPPIESFHLLASIYRISKPDLERRIENFVDVLEIGSLLDTPVRQLSLGEKMRCELAAALLHAPPVLFLDEPTIGLDVVAKQRMRGMLERLNRDAETTILLTSHDLDDIERLCRRVVVIDQGRILHDGTVDALKRLFGNVRRLVIDLMCPHSGLRLPAGAWLKADSDAPSRSEKLDELAEVDGPVAREGAAPHSAQTESALRLEIDFDADVLAAPELLRQVLAQCDARDLRIEEIEIEDVVRRIYERR